MDHLKAIWNWWLRWKIKLEMAGLLVAARISLIWLITLFLCSEVHSAACPSSSWYGQLYGSTWSIR